MSKVKRKEYSEAKNLIYPSTKFREINKILALDNELNIKIIQEINRERKLQKKNYKEPEPFRLEKFKNIASKYLIPLQSENINNKFKKQKHFNNSKSYEHINFIKPLYNSNDHTNSNVSRNYEENIYSIIKEKPLDKETIPIQNSPKYQDITSKQKRRNYILENRLAINELTRPFKEQKNCDISLHRSFGKTPNYIQKFKEEAELLRQEKKKQEEESKYPPGTKLVKEEERVETLKNLLKIKEELNRNLERLPVSNRSVHVNNKRMALWKQLEEIEESIQVFSKKKVFIKDE